MSESTPASGASCTPTGEFVTSSHRPPIRGDAQGWESSHGGPGRGHVLAGGDGLKGRSLLPRPDGKGGRPLAAERSIPTPSCPHLDVTDSGEIECRDCGYVFTEYPS